MKVIDGFTICARQTSDGWIEGTINNMCFQAVVYDEGSSYGINEGRISKLFIWDDNMRRARGDFCAACKVVYERNWDLSPKSKVDKAITDSLVKYLEELPTAAFWENVAEGTSLYTTMEMKSGYAVQVRINIDHTGWAQVIDCSTGRIYKRLDPISVMDILDAQK